MSNPATASNTIQKLSIESFMVGIPISGALDNMIGEGLVIDTVTLWKITADDGETDELTATSIAKNTEPFTDKTDGTTHDIGHVIFFLLGAGIEGRTYRIFFAVTVAATVSTPAQTIAAIVPVEVVG